MVCDFEREWEVFFRFLSGQKAGSAFPNERVGRDASVAARTKVTCSDLLRCDCEANLRVPSAAQSGPKAGSAFAQRGRLLGNDIGTSAGLASWV
jgi:hypothetical protein